MLQAAGYKVAAAGYAIVNLDCVILQSVQDTALSRCDARRIAEILKLEIDQVSLKGKTGEKSRRSRPRRNHSSHGSGAY